MGQIDWPVLTGVAAVVGVFYLIMIAERLKAILGELQAANHLKRHEVLGTRL